jgi:type IV pilus assembly protein PilQ
MVTDTLARAEAIEKLVRDLDHPVRQVQIESRIVIASVNLLHAIGVRFGVTAWHNKRNILAVAADEAGADLVNLATNPSGMMPNRGSGHSWIVITLTPVADSNAGSKSVCHSFSG